MMKQDKSSVMSGESVCEEYMITSNDVTLIEFAANYHCLKTITLEESVRDKIPTLGAKSTQDSLSQLYCDTVSVYTYASEYDYSSDVPYNGFRTICKIVFTYFNRLSLDVKALTYHIKYKRKSKLISSVNELLKFLPLLLHQITSVKLIRKLKSIENDSSSDDELDATLSVELEIISRCIKLTPDDLIAFFSPKVESFWLPASLGKFLRLQSRLVICLSEYPLRLGIQGILSNKKYAQLAAEQTIKWTTLQLAKDNAFMKKFSKSPAASICSVKKYQITERQCRWVVDKNSSSVIENVLAEKTPYTSPPIRVYVVKPKLKQTDRIIFHIHGGGWSLCSPKTYYGVMTQWVREIGATIVSIDYSLAPTHKYPVALQEILDCYLWLTSASTTNTILEPLGFVPQDIVVTGDSAGGNLTIALALLLAEISTKSCEPVKLPRALDIMCPAISPGCPFITASSVLLDHILIFSKRLQFSAAYYTDDPCDGEKSYLGRPQLPWFMNEEKVKAFYTKVNGNKRRDQLFHLFTYKSFDLLKSVPLYIQGAEFDPLSDDSILIAQKWKGPVHLQIMPNVVHAYMLMADVSQECKKANDETTKQLKDALVGSSPSNPQNHSKHSP